MAKATRHQAERAVAFYTTAGRPLSAAELHALENAERTLERLDRKAQQKRERAEAEPKDDGPSELAKRLMAADREPDPPPAPPIDAPPPPIDAPPPPKPERGPTRVGIAEPAPEEDLPQLPRKQDDASDPRHEPPPYNDPAPEPPTPVLLPSPMPDWLAAMLAETEPDRRARAERDRQEAQAEVDRAALRRREGRDAFYGSKAGRSSRAVNAVEQYRASQR
jgi:hypothetical protein